MKRSQLLSIYLVTFSLLFTQFALQQKPVSIHYIVYVDAEGNGRWYIEHRYALKTDEDLEAFQAAAANISLTFEKEYRLRIERIIEEASSIIGRHMSLGNFSINTTVFQTVTGPVGVVTISFQWLGFARKDGEKILIGDVFIGGMLLLEGESFTVKIPESLVIESVSPKPDEYRENMITWYGRKSFVDGEPKITASPFAGTSGGEGQTSPIIQTLTLAAIASIAFALILYFRKRPKHVEHSDIQAIIKVLKKHGGITSQSTIVEETGMSKAKVSLLLKMLEADGRVTRFKQKNEKIVRLTG